MVTRRYTFKAYPNVGQTERLDQMRRLHCALYNGALQERIDCYRLTGKSLSYYDQSASLKPIRAALPEYGVLSSDCLAATLQRVDRAFKAYFRKVDAFRKMAPQERKAFLLDENGKPRKNPFGYPQFKSAKFYPGFSYRKHGSGWRLRHVGGKDWRLYLLDLKRAGLNPELKVRGRFPTDCKFKTCELMLRDGQWWLSVVVEQEARLSHGDEIVVVDWDLDGISVKTLNGGCPSALHRAFSDAWHGRNTVRYQADKATSGVVTGKTNGGDRDWRSHERRTHS